MPCSTKLASPNKKKKKKKIIYNSSMKKRWSGKIITPADKLGEYINVENKLKAKSVIHFEKRLSRLIWSQDWIAISKCQCTTQLTYACSPEYVGTGLSFEGWDLNLRLSPTSADELRILDSLPLALPTCVCSLLCCPHSSSLLVSVKTWEQAQGGTESLEAEGWGAWCLAHRGSHKGGNGPQLGN